jgi:hypothetical protein
MKKLQQETPEEYKDRTGQPWADYSAVYMRIGRNDGRMKAYWESKFDAGCCRMDNVPYENYCANSDAGIPGRWQAKIEKAGEGAGDQSHGRQIV